MFLRLNQVWKKTAGIARTAVNRCPSGSLFDVSACGPAIKGKKYRQQLFCYEQLLPGFFISVRGSTLFYKRWVKNAACSSQRRAQCAYPLPESIEDQAMVFMIAFTVFFISSTRASESSRFFATA
jgi:hypothetical protein